jgi:hypothetical protein
MQTATGRASLRREDVKYDESRLKRGCQAIQKRLAKGIPSVVGLIYIPSSEVKPDGTFNEFGEGGHSVPVVGCNADATKFLYIDVYPEGSKLTYSGGHAGRDLFPEECNYLGMFELTNDTARGVLRAARAPRHRGTQRDLFRFAVPRNSLRAIDRLTAYDPILQEAFASAHVSHEDEQWCVPVTRVSLYTRFTHIYLVITANRSLSHQLAPTLNLIVSNQPTPMSKDQNGTLSRRDQKLQLVRTRGQVSFDELARHFPVPDDTIRRDLQALERRRLLLSGPE